jgi:acyl-CoA reductase-like NAD-dependent aldehyde dehydrogenase
VIVNGDADVEYAAERVAWGGFVYSGQTCISVQRVLVHEDVYEAFAADLVRRVGDLKLGDPLDEATDVGPVIDAESSDRIQDWVEDARAAGADVLTGGEREGTLWQPTVLANVRHNLRVSCDEVFAPLVCLSSFNDVQAAIDEAGRSEFGLQGGLFTNDMRVVEAAFDRIDVGGLNVNDVSTFRIDHMPYGGVKSSGLGREGLRYAIEEMTEQKLLTFNNRPEG